jgi:hypothetical protein
MPTNTSDAYWANARCIAKRSVIVCSLTDEERHKMERSLIDKK